MNNKDSFNSICKNLTGYTADEIIVCDKDWQYIARRFASADAVMCNQPEWFANPIEALQANEKTFEDFIKTHEKGYTLAQLFEYISDEGVNEILLDSDDDVKLNNKIYKKLAEAIVKAYQRQ